MKAKLQLRLSDSSGRTVAERRSENTVMLGGAHLLAELFSGTGSPITHMGVGTNDESPDDVLAETLSNAPVGEAAALEGETTAPIPPDAFSITPIEERHVVQVRVRGTLGATDAVGMVREAGLLAGTGESAVLYNRVVFAPMDKRDDHELTLFWEVEFPYGDLQWLT